MNFLFNIAESKIFWSIISLIYFFYLFYVGYLLWTRGGALFIVVEAVSLILLFVSVYNLGKLFEKDGKF